MVVHLMRSFTRLRVRKEYHSMEKKNIDWSNLGFGYIKTDYRYVSNYKDGAWDYGATLNFATDDPTLSPKFTYERIEREYQYSIYKIICF